MEFGIIIAKINSHYTTNKITVCLKKAFPAFLAVIRKSIVGFS